jgi:hypothetical protein
LKKDEPDERLLVQILRKISIIKEIVESDVLSATSRKPFISLRYHFFLNALLTLRRVITQNAVLMRNI